MVATMGIPGRHRRRRTIVMPAVHPFRAGTGMDAESGRLMTLQSHPTAMCLVYRRWPTSRASFGVPRPAPPQQGELKARLAGLHLRRCGSSATCPTAGHATATSHGTPSSHSHMAARQPHQHPTRPATAGHGDGPACCMPTTDAWQSRVVIMTFLRRVSKMFDRPPAIFRMAVLLACAGGS